MTLSLDDDKCASFTRARRMHSITHNQMQRTRSCSQGLQGSCRDGASLLRVWLRDLKHLDVHPGGVQLCEGVCARTLSRSMSAA